MSDTEPRPPPRATLTGVAQTLASNLQSQPMIIGLLLVNIAFLAVVFLSVREARQHDHSEMLLLLERCIPRTG